MSEQLCQHTEVKLSGYLDGELTQQESQTIYLHLKSCERCQQLYQELKSMQQSVAQLEKPTMSELELKKIMNDRPSRGFQWIGWLLLITGVSVIVAFTAYQFISSEGPLWIKLTLSAIYGGVAFLFLTVLRQRIIARKTDKYKGVDL